MDTVLRDANGSRNDGPREERDETRSVRETRMKRRANEFEDTLNTNTLRASLRRLLGLSHSFAFSLLVQFLRGRVCALFDLTTLMAMKS